MSPWTFLDLGFNLAILHSSGKVDFIDKFIDLIDYIDKFDIFLKRISQYFRTVPQTFCRNSVHSKSFTGIKVKQRLFITPTVTFDNLKSLDTLCEVLA